MRVFGDDGEPVEVAGARLRTLLGRLALAAGRAVPSEALIEDIWGAGAPSGAANTLHALVHRLRRALPSAGLVESLAVGYRLAVPADGVDAHRFEVLAARGGRELAAGDPGRAAATLGDALALWRGTPFADLPAAPFAGPAVVRLEELRAAAREDRFDAALQLGRHAEVLPDLEVACADDPLRERLAALRMRARYAAGRQSDALAGYEEIRARLADELGVDPSAELRRTQLAVLRGDLDRSAASTEAAPGRLPSRLTSFIGRDDELKAVAELMESARLVTVVGPGGVGKTRLAVEAASEHRAYRSGRLWLVGLAGVENRRGVAGAILGALSAGTGQLGGAPIEPLDRVAELLGGGDAVLVLDNCEHVVAEVGRVARQLLEARPRLTILATSRESLDVMGEALCRLGPLDVPTESAAVTGAVESAAVRLLLDRASAVRPGFTLDESTVGSIVDVVRRLDGMPLALELAAARLRSMSIGQVAQRLDDRFRLLSSGNRAAQPRQRTLRAVIGWSWELLTESERVLARRMAIFPAASGADAIEAVCADEAPLVPEDVFYVLDSLVDKSLVEQSGNGYRMLESIRAFAADELSRAGERETVRHRFTSYFAALAAEHEPLVRSRHQTSSLTLLTGEYDNLMFALRSALDGRDPAAAVRLLGLLHWYWYLVRHDARTESLVAETLAFGDALPGDARAAFTAIDELIGESAPTTDTERVRALIAGCADTGALERYPMLLMVTLPIAHQLGLDDLVEAEMVRVRSRPDPWAKACMSLLEARIAGDRGDWTGLTSARARAVHEFTAAGDRLLTAVSLAVLSEVHSVRGEHDAAITGLERGIALAAGAQDEVTYLVALAIVRMRAGDLDGAGRDLDAAERLTRARGLWYMGPEALRGRAELHRRAGDCERSELALDRLAELTDQLRLPGLERWLAPARMALRLTTGDAAGARELLPAAITGTQASGDPAPAAQQLARLLFLEGDFPGSATALGLSEAIRGAFDHGDPELRELVTELTRQLGERDYDAAYRAGARLSRPDALARLGVRRDPALYAHPVPVRAV